jgi:hypothetical protein
VHRVENRERCTDRTRMPRINNQIRKSELARALATGGTVAAWSQANDVAERTAYTWSRSPEVLDKVEAIRRAALEQAIGRLSGQATDAAQEITRLAREAVSEAVRLQAARAVLAELMTVSNYTALERRMAEIERRIAEGPGTRDEPVTSPDRPATSSALATDPAPLT